MSFRSMLAPLVLLSATLGGCASSLPVVESREFALSEDQLQNLTETTIENMEQGADRGWVKLASGNARETKAQYLTGSGHRTDVTITYRKTGENRSKAIFDGESTADVNILWIPGLQGKSDSIRHVDMLLDEIQAKAPAAPPSS